MSLRKMYLVSPDHYKKPLSRVYTSTTASKTVYFEEN